MQRRAAETTERTLLVSLEIDGKQNTADLTYACTCCGSKSITLASTVYFFIVHTCTYNTILPYMYTRTKEKIVPRVKLTSTYALQQHYYTVYLELKLYKGKNIKWIGFCLVGGRVK